MNPILLRTRCRPFAGYAAISAFSGRPGYPSNPKRGAVLTAVLRNPAKPVEAQRKSRFIGEMNIED